MKTVVRWFSLLIILLTALPLPGLAAQPEAPGSSIVVTTLVDAGYNDDGYCSLREAISAADLNSPQYGCPGGDSVNLDTITFAVDGTINLDESLPVVLNAGPLVIDGGADKDITINGGGSHRIFYEVLPGAVLTLKNLTIYNGYAGVDGKGAGLYNNGGTVDIEGCTFNLNTADGDDSAGGGLYNTDGEVTIRDSTFANNEASSGGGIYTNNGQVEIYDTEINSNKAGAGGGLFISFSDKVWIYSSTFYHNEVVGSGGGVYVGWDSTATISDTVFTHNKSESGGGLSSIMGKVTIDSCEFMTNTTTYGGALYFQGDYGTPFPERRFPDNQADRFVSIEFSIQDSVFRDNNALHGAGIFTWYESGTIVGSEFSGNTAEEKGGAIYHNNSHWNAHLGVVNSTFSENTGGWGGAVLNITGTLAITNSTLYSNSAAVMANSLYNSYSSKEAFEVQNSIIADNGSGANCFGPITDGGHNLDTGTTCGFSPDKGSLNSTDPLLGPLDQNASPKLSKTHAPLLGSPAVNQADFSFCPVDDQRGFDRRDGYCDIGAYEAQLASVSALSGSGQSTLVLTYFPNPLRVELKDQYGNHLGGVPVTFTGPASGAGISNSGSGFTSNQTGIVAFTAFANETVGGPYQVKASSGAYQASFSLTNMLYDSATQITSDAPDPSSAGETFTVQFKVTSGQGTPPGSVTVTVSDRGEKCTGQLGAGQGSCSLSIPTPGEYTLVATYSGSIPYMPSSDAETHTVRAAGIGDFQLFLPLVMYTPEQPFR